MAVDPTASVGGQIDGVHPELVIIGRYCVVGAKAAVLTHCPIRGGLPAVLGDYVWMGYGSVVLPGVTIGSYCVIGANAVVTRDMPGGCVIAGNPARAIRRLSEEEKKSLAERIEQGDPMG